MSYIRNVVAGFLINFTGFQVIVLGSKQREKQLKLFFRSDRMATKNQKVVRFEILANRRSAE